MLNLFNPMWQHVGTAWKSGLQTRGSPLRFPAEVSALVLVTVITRTAVEHRIAQAPVFNCFKHLQAWKIPRAGRAFLPSVTLRGRPPGRPRSRAHHGVIGCHGPGGAAGLVVRHGPGGGVYRDRIAVITSRASPRASTECQPDNGDTSQDRLASSETATDLRDAAELDLLRPAGPPISAAGPPAPPEVGGRHRRRPLNDYRAHRSRKGD